MNQQPIQTDPETQEKLSGSRILLGASIKYCTSVSYAPGSLIRSGSANQGAIYFIEDGLAVAAKRFANGKTQIVTLYVPGDIINHEEIAFGRCFSEVSAATKMKLARISASDFVSVLNADRLYERAFYLFVAYQAILAQEWLGNIGRRNALQRTAHVLCELFCRLEMASLTVGDTCHMPLTQHILADITGLSLVHQNRSIKQIKDAGLVTFASKRFRIVDWNGLAELAEFDRGYLDVAKEISASERFGQRTTSVLSPPV